MISLKTCRKNDVYIIYCNLFWNGFKTGLAGFPLKKFGHGGSEGFSRSGRGFSGLFVCEKEIRRMKYDIN